MQNNYHFLRRLTPVLGARLKGSVISECYSQEKAALIIRFETADGPFYMRASLSAAFTCLSFPRDFQRARRNSVDLFPEIAGRHVEGVIQYANDRSFSLMLSDGYLLLFKLHGNRSNILLFADGELHERFRKNIDADLRLQPDKLSRPVDTSYEAFARRQQDLPGLYFTFGKIPWLYLQAKGFATQDITTRWSSLQHLLSVLEQPHYYIILLGGKVTFSLLSVGTVLRQFDDPVTALNEFYALYLSREGLDQERSSLEGLIRRRIQHAGDAQDRAHARLQALTTHDKYKVWADLLMANLHNAPESEQIVVANFYNDNRPEVIRLQRDLSLQQNAALYYAKSKKQHVEVAHLSEMITQRKAEITSLNDQLASIAEMSDVKALRAFAASHQLHKAREEPRSLPFHETVFMGFRILVGRHAQANDEMLQRYSFKDDLWLHAKDVAGSHVLIKHQAGKTMPRPVIERAAQLAAWYSKRKTDTLCPVSFTPRKYVRKRKGDPAGLVVVERESVILVEPLALPGI